MPDRIALSSLILARDVARCRRVVVRIALCGTMLNAACGALGQSPAVQSPAVTEAPAETAAPREANQADAERRAELEAAFAKKLSGATLDGNFTSTGGGIEADMKLSRDKYTLGEVRKTAGDMWLFRTRIQYGDKDVTVPLPLAVQWAGDTPVVVVDDVTIPGMGTFSARVMFFADHYAGYWKHGERGGHLFGLVQGAKGEE